jgi:hypothetical protein
MKFVGLIFKPVQLEHATSQLVGFFSHLFEMGQCALEISGLLDKDFRQELGGFGWRAKFIQPEPLADFLHIVDEIVDFGGERMNIIAIERGDEGGIERRENAVRHFVALRLKIGEPADPPIVIGAAIDDFGQQLRHLDRVFSGVGEMREELLVARQESR